MAKLIMMVGVSYSGKSYEAQKLADEYNGVIVSSDAIRGELYGDESIQRNHARVFELAHQRINAALAENKVVIYDATNLNAKRRMNFLKSIAHFNCEKICSVVIANPETLKARMAERDRYVPWEVVEKQIKQFQTPWYHEGWDDILTTVSWYPGLKDSYSLKKDGLRADNISQDNPWHDFTIGEHMQKTYKLYRELVAAKAIPRTNAMDIATRYHDIGKMYTKTFTDMKGNPSDRAHFYFHQNYGAYLILCDNQEDYDINALYSASLLVTYHMEYFVRNEQSYDKLLHDLNEAGFFLAILHYCDEHSAKE